MLSLERSRDLYEQIPAYPQPPQAPIPPVNSREIEKRLELKLNRFTRFLVDAALAGAGFGAFYKNAPDNLEALQRRINLRGPALFAPVVSATLVLSDDPRQLSMIDRAVTLALGGYQLYKAVWSGELPVDEINDQPCEMGQYPNFFSTSLVFENGRPRVFKSSNINQLTVLAANRIFILKIDDWEAPMIALSLQAGLNDILRQAQQPAPGAKLTPAVITSTKDVVQFRAFREISKSAINAESLEMLKHSFFTFCFDVAETPATLAAALKLAHSANLTNRWFHASLQFVVFGNAMACAVCSFSAYLDGNTMVRGIAEMQRRAARTQVLPAASFARPVIHEPQWEIAKSFVAAAESATNVILDHQAATFTIDGFGTRFFNSLGVKAVPSFVLALQMAVKRLTGEIIPITQFLTMSKYRCMDLTTVMVTTPAVEEFVYYLDAGNLEVQKALELYQNAVSSQIAKLQQARRWLPIDDLINYFLASRKKAQKWRALVILGLLFQILKKTGALKAVRRNIVLSHPAIYPEAPLLGRPGVRLPYVTCFGLHYQIFPESISLTFMPGLAWETPNERLVEELRNCLEEIGGLLKRTGIRQEALAPVQ